MEDYNKALDADPNFLYALYNRSILKRDLGDLEGSIEDMNRAISIYAKNYMMYYQLGLTLSELDRDEEAIAAFTKALKIESKHTQSPFNRAVCYNAVGNLKAALKDDDARIKLNP